MKVYLVGGAVRDKLLGEPVLERDWVVVGGTPEALLKAGYQQVGRDFPVFLHPKTKEEYALARTERKTGRGHAGFSFDTSQLVSLEEDLSRRDLTINAIAEDESGELIDPYGGVQDLKHKVLRHVSPAFVEDPLRVLRVARFAARFRHLGFSIAPETLALMQHITASGELLTLSPERIWQEWEKSLSTAHPEVFIEVLEAIGALFMLFKHLDATGIKSAKKSLMAVSAVSEDAEIRFAAFIKHVVLLEDIAEFAKLHRLPKGYANLAKNAIFFIKNAQVVHQARAAQVLEVLEKLNVFRNEAQFMRLLTACEVSTMLRSRWCIALRAAKMVNVNELVQLGYQGSQMKVALQKARTKAIQLGLEHE